MGKFSAIILCLVLTSAAIGCGQSQQPRAASSHDAIQNSQAMQTSEQKADYLISQANQFLNSKEYNEAISTAQYVLINVDQNSRAAKETIEKAKAELAKVAQKSVDDMKKQLENLGR